MRRCLTPPPRDVFGAFPARAEDCPNDASVQFVTAVGADKAQLLAQQRNVSRCFVVSPLLPRRGGLGLACSALLAFKQEMEEPLG